MSWIKGTIADESKRIRNALDAYEVQILQCRQKLARPELKKDEEQIKNELDACEVSILRCRQKLARVNECMTRVKWQRICQKYERTCTHIVEDYADCLRLIEDLNQANIFLDNYEELFMCLERIPILFRRHGKDCPQWFVEKYKTEIDG